MILTLLFAEVGDDEFALEPGSRARMQFKHIEEASRFSIPEKQADQHRYSRSHEQPK